MKKILVISTNSELASFVGDSPKFHDQLMFEANDWAHAKELLNTQPFDFVFLDYESLRREGSDVFIRIDSFFEKVDSLVVLLIRQQSEATTRVEKQLESLLTVIDLSLGGDNFEEELESIIGVDEIKQRLNNRSAIEAQSLAKLRKRVARLVDATDRSLTEYGEFLDQDENDEFRSDLNTVKELLVDANREELETIVTSLEASAYRLAEISPPSRKPKGPKETFREGYRKYQNNDFPAAFEHIENAHKLDPKNGLYMTFYGYLMFKNDPTRLDEAEDTIHKALKVGRPEALPHACLFLGYLLVTKGHHEEAIRQFERRLLLKPGCREAERELRRLKS